MAIIAFVAIYALLGGPALTINSWLGDQNQFIQPGTEPADQKAGCEDMQPEESSLKSEILLSFTFTFVTEEEVGRKDFPSLSAIAFALLV